MLDKMALAVVMAYWKLRNKVDELKNNEDGMETIEAVILIAIAVVIALAIVNLLTKGKFGDSNGGVIGYIFEQIKTKIDDIFNSAPATT